MADKKMTQLEDLGTSLSSSDIMHVVTDPANNPVNKKGTVSDIFGNLNHSTTTSESGGKTFLNTELTVTEAITYSGNLASSSTKTSIAPATSNTYIPGIYGQKTNLTVSGNLGWFPGDVIAHEIVLDVTDGITSDRFQTASKQYGLKIMIQDSSEDRATAPSAFICLNDRIDATLLASDSEDPRAVTTLISLGDRNGERVKTTTDATLFEGGNALMASGMNAHTVFTETDNIAKIKIKVNDTDYYLLATSNNHYAPVA